MPHTSELTLKAVSVMDEVAPVFTTGGKQASKRGHVTC